MMDGILAFQRYQTLFDLAIKDIKHLTKGIIAMNTSIKHSKASHTPPCPLCKQKEILFTSPGSNNKAEIYMQAKNFLTFNGDEGISYHIKCTYCPQCGRKLDC